MRVNKNRTREANNAKARDAMDFGMIFYSRKDYRWAYKYFETAAAAGHSQAAHWLKKTSEKLSMDNNINTEEYDRNLLTSNIPAPKPQIAPSFRLPKENKVQVIDIHQSQNDIKKTLTQNKKPLAQNTDIEKKSATPEYDRLKKRAKAGDSEAQYQLGKRRWEQARRYLEKAALQNHEGASAMLSKITPQTEPSTEQASADVPPTEQTSVEIPSTVQASADDPLTEQTSVELPPTVQASADVPPTEQPSAEIPPSEQASAEVTPMEETIGSGQITPSSELLQFNYLYQPHTPCGCLPTLKLVWQLIHYYLHQKLFSYTAKNGRK